MKARQYARLLDYEDEETGVPNQRPGVSTTTATDAGSTSTSSSSRPTVAGGSSGSTPFIEQLLACVAHGRHFAGQHFFNFYVEEAEDEPAETVLVALSGRARSNPVVRSTIGGGSRADSAGCHCGELAIRPFVKHLWDQAKLGSRAADPSKGAVSNRQGGKPCGVATARPGQLGHLKDQSVAIVFRISADDVDPQSKSAQEGRWGATVGLHCGSAATGQRRVQHASSDQRVGHSEVGPERVMAHFDSHRRLECKRLCLGLEPAAEYLFLGSIFSTFLGMKLSETPRRSRCHDGVGRLTGKQTPAQPDGASRLPHRPASDIGGRIVRNIVAVDLATAVAESHPTRVRGNDLIHRWLQSFGLCTFVPG